MDLSEVSSPFLRRVEGLGVKTEGKRIRVPCPSTLLTIHQNMVKPSRDSLNTFPPTSTKSKPDFFLTHVGWKKPPLYETFDYTLVEGIDIGVNDETDQDSTPLVVGKPEMDTQETEVEAGAALLPRRTTKCCNQNNAPGLTRT